jgi:uncharacterized membrane protein YphA (DoxX/SURF4 family)
MMKRTYPDLGLLFVRVPFGLFFAIAGLNKIKGGVSAFASGAMGTIPSYMPTALGKAYLYAVPWAELVVGAMLVIGLFTRFNAFIAALMVTSFTVAVTGIWDGGKPFNANLIFIGVCLGLALIGPGRFSADAFLPRRGKS